MKRIILVAVALGLACPASAQSEGDIYTLYRNSALDATMRIHVATFDTAEGKDYNAENCFAAADLFQGQDGVSTRFWCEPGRYRR